MSIKEQVLKDSFKFIFKYNVEELGQDLLMNEGTPKNIMKFGKKAIDLTIHKTKEQILKEIDKHRKKAVITCDKNCFCWDIESLLSKKEHPKK